MDDVSSPVIEEFESIPRNLSSFRSYKLKTIKLRIKQFTSGKSSVVLGNNGILLGFTNGAVTTKNPFPLALGEKFQTIKF